MPDENIVYLLTYDHGGVILWGADHFAERLRDAVAWLKRYPSFKIGLENEAYAYDALAERHPELLEELRAYLSRFRGRLGIGTCTYGQPLSTFIDDESNIRQIAYARRTNLLRLGCTPAIYLMSEHAHHCQIPQILAGFGFQGAIMRTHFMMYGYNPTFDLPIGWWVGVDGSRIPAIPTYPGEGAAFGKTTSDNWILTRYPGPECSTSLEEWQAQFRHIRPLLASRADDAGLRREDLVRQLEGKYGFRWILLEELLEAFPKPVQEMPTGPNDFHTRMPWGYCGNEIWVKNRAAETEVLAAERLAALARMSGAPSQEPGLERAWKNLLTAQHHDIQICGLLDDARRFLGASLDASRRVAGLSLEYLANRMCARGCAQITLFNPLSFSRSEWVAADIVVPAGAADRLTVRRNGRSIPCRLLGERHSEDGSSRVVTLAFRTKVNALETVACCAVPGDAQALPEVFRWDAHRRTLATPFHHLNLDGRGFIARIADAQTGRTLLGGPSGACFIAGTIESAHHASVGSWDPVPKAAAAPYVQLHSAGTVGPIPYEWRVTLHAHTPRIDMRLRFRFDGEKIGRPTQNQRDAVSPFVHAEKLRLKIFPLLQGKVVAARHLPFVIAEGDPEAADGVYWCAAASNESGVAVFNRGSMGIIREEDGAFSIPLAYAHYYIWGTRMLHGEYEYELALYPFRGKWQRVDLHRRALEYLFPLRVHTGAPGDATLGTSWSPIRLAADGVVLTALYPEQENIIARLAEYRGRRSWARMDLPAGASLTEVDLAGRSLGRPQQPLHFDPWRIRTFRIETGAKGPQP
ncbi:MAG: glycosyl hydrolase-related protein [Chthonomonadales bacterium]